MLNTVPVPLVLESSAANCWRLNASVLKIYLTDIIVELIKKFLLIEILMFEQTQIFVKFRIDSSSIIH